MARGMVGEEGEAGEGENSWGTGALAAKEGSLTSKALQSFHDDEAEVGTLITAMGCSWGQSNRRISPFYCLRGKESVPN